MPNARGVYLPGSSLILWAIFIIGIAVDYFTGRNLCMRSPAKTSPV